MKIFFKLFSAKWRLVELDDITRTDERFFRIRMQKTKKKQHT